jgi:hypothetical protein
MYGKLYPGALTTFLILVLLVASSFAATKDPCAEEGIIVKNLTMLDLWDKKNGGECTIWIHNHIFVINPKDTVDIFSDLTCKTTYCKDNPTYEIYKSFDKNRDCGVKILPDCSLSDM